MSHAATVSSAMRDAILHAAYGEFVLRGYQGGSINRIISAAEATKGALFHYFSSKKALGLAVLEEVILPQVRGMWVSPLEKTDDPAACIAECIERESRNLDNHIKFGCPLGNFSQEMSPLDEDFRVMIEGAYDAWRSAMADSIRRGQKAGKIRSGVDPTSAAAFAVAAFTGMLAHAKNSQDSKLLMRSALGLRDYMLSLRK